MKHRLRSLALVGLLALLTVAPFVHAFGATSPYWDRKHLALHPGESAEVPIFMQNMLGEENVTVKVGLAEGKELAAFTEEKREYFLPFGSKDVVVNVTISVPQNFTIGGYQVGVSFTEVVAREKGKMVQMGTGVKVMIPVDVVSVNPPQAEGKVLGADKTVLAAGIVLIVVVILVIAVVLMRKKKRK